MSTASRSSKMTAKTTPKAGSSAAKAPPTGNKASTASQLGASKTSSVASSKTGGMTPQNKSQAKPSGVKPAAATDRNVPTTQLGMAQTPKGLQEPASLKSKSPGTKSQPQFSSNNTGRNSDRLPSEVSGEMMSVGPIGFNQMSLSGSHMGSSKTAGQANGQMRATTEADDDRRNLQMSDLHENHDEHSRPNGEEQKLPQFYQDPLFTVKDLQEEGAGNKREEAGKNSNNPTSIQMSPKNDPSVSNSFVDQEALKKKEAENELTIQKFSTQVQLLALENTRLHDDLASKDEAIKKLTEDLQETTKLFSEIPKLRIQVVLMAMEIERIESLKEEITQLRFENEQLKVENGSLLNENSEAKKEVEKVGEIEKKLSDSRHAETKERIGSSVMVQAREWELSQKHEEEITRIRKEHFLELEKMEEKANESKELTDWSWSLKLSAMQKEAQKKEDSLLTKHEGEVRELKEEIIRINEEITKNIQNEIAKWNEKRLPDYRVEQKTELEKALSEEKQKSQELRKKIEAHFEEEIKLNAEKDSILSEKMRVEREVERLTKSEERLARIEQEMNQLIVEKQVGEAEFLRVRALYKSLEEDFKELEVKQRILNEKADKEEENKDMIRKQEKQLKTLQERLDHEIKLKEMLSNDIKELRRSLVEQDQEIIRLRQAIENKEHLLSILEIKQSERLSQKELEVMEAKVEMQNQVNRLRKLYEDSLDKKQREIDVLLSQIEETTRRESFKINSETPRMSKTEPNFRSKEVQWENEKLRESIFNIMLPQSKE